MKELQELHSALEEAKADIVGLWALKFLINQVSGYLAVVLTYIINWVRHCVDACMYVCSSVKVHYQSSARTFCCHSLCCSIFILSNAVLMFIINQVISSCRIFTFLFALSITILLLQVVS